MTPLNRSTLVALSLAFALAQGACAWMMPSDPYMDAKVVKSIDVPAGLDTPTPDPNLSVPDGDTAAIPIEGGHRPPNAAPALQDEPRVDAVKADVAPEGK